MNETYRLGDTVRVLVRKPFKVWPGPYLPSYEEMRKEMALEYVVVTLSTEEMVQEANSPRGIRLYE